jgi:transposase
MFYLGIDQHARQLTICLRDEGGKAVLRRQVSTEPKRVREFLHQLENQCIEAGGYVAVVEVCGFNDWLLKLLPEYGCKEVVLVQPEDRDRRKTDRRDAHRLSELLWINRERLLASQHVQGLRRVFIPSADDQHDRQLTQLRKRLGASRTRLINRVKHALVKHNLQHGCPTKGIRTQAARAWLKKLTLPAIDRLEVDQAMAQWDLIDEQIAAADEQIAQRAEGNANARLIATLYGTKPAYAALALAASIGPISRFPRPRSLANYWGLTPGCRNSGEATQRLGSITKQGSKTARFLLCQLSQHVLRRDAWMREWYKRIKRRRGSKIARVAVMRRLATIIWQMLSRQHPYMTGEPARSRSTADSKSKRRRGAA